MRFVFIGPLAFFLVLQACGGSTELGDSPHPLTASATSGAGAFYVQSNVPAAGSTTSSSYERRVTFTTTTCASTKAGPCTVNPCFTSSTADAGEAFEPNAGNVTIRGAQMQPLILSPGANGLYTPDTVKGQGAWTGDGQPITFEWANLPGSTSSPGGMTTLATPPYITLTPGSAFASSPTTLARSQDLTVTWSSDTPPAQADQVAVDLQVGSTQLVCIFAVSAGSGVIPTAALAMIEAGPGTFNVHSKEGRTLSGVDGSGWSLGFNVDAQARASYGLVKGNVTFQ